MKRQLSKRIVNTLSKGVFIFLLIGFTSLSVFAQTGTQLSGQVLDEKGIGLPGATVLEEGTSNGTTTDLDGGFNLKLSGESAKLVISFIGYTPKEVQVGNQTSFKVDMEIDAQSLEEVIVVGYGEQTKKTLTGSVVQVSGDDVISGKATSSAALSLQGEMPGVNITRSSSRPGKEGIDIKIRGDISVNGVSPLVLLDGLVIAEWELSTINPNDIESISVLKDAAAAIYGTRAAGGVILVTTKKGKAGKMKVEYNGQFQINMPQELPVADLQEFAGLWLEAGDNDAISYVDGNGVEQVAPGSHRFFSRDQYVSMIDGTFPLAPDPVFWNGKDQFIGGENQIEAIYGDTFSQRHSLSISGGTDQATFRTSFGYNDERSPIAFVYDGAKRFNFRTNVAYNINDMFSTVFNVSYDDRLVDSPTQGVGNGIADPDFYPLYNPLGQYYGEWGNVLALLDEGGRTTVNDQIIRLGGKLNLDLDKYVQGLSFSYDLNVGLTNSERNERTTSVTTYDFVGNVTVTPTTLANSYFRTYLTNNSKQMHTVQGNYKKSLGKNNLALTLGATAQLDTYETNYYGISGLISDDLDHVNLGDPATYEVGGRPRNNEGNNFQTQEEEDALLSYLGKFNYNYDGIFLLEGMVRRDGSSRLDPEFRWKNFFGFSGGVRVSDLAFMPSGLFDNLKLRASYGETGSQGSIGRYDYLSNMNLGTTVFGVSPSQFSTASIAGITDSNRTWERVSTTNFAVDFGVLNNRLSGTVEYFIRKNDGMLTSLIYPQILGGGAPETNAGEFVTKGWEAALNWKDQVGDLTYNVGLMAWDNQSEVTKFEGATVIELGSNANLLGKPLNALYTYKTDGILSSEEEVTAYYNQVGFADESDHNVMRSGTNLPAFNTQDRLTTGNVRRVDVNEDGVINEEDLVYYGDANPHYSMGIKLGAKWKGIDFNVFFQGVAQQNIRREGALSYPFNRWWTGQNSSFLGNTWNEDNTDAIYPKSFQNGQRKDWNYNLNDINIIQASYLRAKLIQLGYTLPTSIISKAGLGRVRFSVTGTDLFVISNVTDGLDPENNSDAGRGSTIPFTSTILFGVDILF